MQSWIHTEHRRKDLQWYVNVSAQGILNAPANLNADVNECSTNNGGCDQICVNVDGGFYCECQTGFLLASNQQTCNGKQSSHATHVTFT